MTQLKTFHAASLIVLLRYVNKDFNGAEAGNTGLCYTHKPALEGFLSSAFMTAVASVKPCPKYPGDPSPPEPLLTFPV